MRPSELVRAKAAEIRALTARYPTLVHPRVFGSAARGDDGPDSDIDILVDALPGTTLFRSWWTDGGIEGARREG